MADYRNPGKDTVARNNGKNYSANFDNIFGNSLKTENTEEEVKIVESKI